MNQGNKLKNYLHINKVKKIDFAKKIDCQPSYLHFLFGKEVLSDKIKSKINEVLGLSDSWWYTNDPEPTKFMEPEEVYLTFNQVTEIKRLKEEIMIIKKEMNLFREKFYDLENKR